MSADAEQISGEATDKTGVSALAARGVAVVVALHEARSAGR